jgi:hypothetical protein
MAAFAEGKVVSIVEERPGLVRARVATPDGEIDAAGFPDMLGPLRAGDRVVVNITGIALRLGTGGVGFIVWNLDGRAPAVAGEGHIVKLRYTPWQTEVLAAEELESPHHERLAEVDSIDGMPVVACSLHSQIAAVAAGVKAARPDARVGYLMTDGAALPLAWSDLVANLERVGLVDVTCTAGHSFGGDLEAVNVFSGLAVLRFAAEVDVAVVAMGPGVVGTDTVLGFTGMEQGQVLDATTALGGRAIACLRIGFADPRERHRGVSHHCLTALRLAARERATVVVPVLSRERAALVSRQLADAGIDGRHDVVTVDGSAGLALLRERGVEPTSMGRALSSVPELFLAGAAAGAEAAR